MKLNQYPKYKESNIDWIGHVPEEWKIKKIKHFSISIAGGTPNTNNLAYWDGNIPWLPSGMIHDDLIEEEDVKTFITLGGLQNSSTKWIKKDAVLVALTGATCANIAYLTFRATANQSVIGIECDNKSYPKFFFYYLLSQREQILLNQTGGAQAGINKEDVKNLICAYPNKETQKQIADFLDKKTTEINNLLERDKQLIELLKEKRIALINHVVTKGLNPKAKFKDSGIDWIGKIPESWEVKRLKFICKFEYGQSLSDEDREDGEINVFGSNGIVGQHNKSITKKPCVIIGRKGSFGKINLSDKECFPIDTTYYVDENYTENNLYWLYYCLQSLKLDELSRDSAVPGLNREEAYERIAPIPPKSEQTQIVEYLDKATSKIDEAVKKIEKRIELLEEYKKSLIHNVVTGKVDVRSI